MENEQRRKVVAHKLVDMGLTLTSWSAQNGLHYKIVTDLLDGKLRGTRGVALETRRIIEKVFGPIFDT